MRREALYLRDIIEAADAIAEFIQGVNAEAFRDNDLLRSAVLHKLTIIGEAAARIPKDFRDKHREIAWADIIGFRNIVVHAYFAIDWGSVWVTATEDVPYLRQAIVIIAEQEFGSEFS
ncbi:MAG: DUF86 domain-containing protein [Nitrososphaera sp.]|nr:DUF86 domain-containing protein [Nitrososphaera sp.]